VLLARSRLLKTSRAQEGRREGFRTEAIGTTCITQYSNFYADMLAYLSPPPGEWRTPPLPIRVSQAIATDGQDPFGHSGEPNTGLLCQAGAERSGVVNDNFVAPPQARCYSAKSKNGMSDRTGRPASAGFGPPL
jgi:hypothetical protein